MRNTLAVGLLATVLLAAGCSSEDPVYSPSPSAAGEPAAQGAAPAPVTLQTSGDIVAALAGAVPQAKLVIVFDEDTDPNNDLGRPGGYISKAAFRDSRVPSDVRSTTKGDIANGGGIEVFETAAQAKKRADYLQEVIDATGGFVGRQYTYVSDTTVLRLSEGLTPRIAKQYRNALPDAVKTGRS